MLTKTQFKEQLEGIYTEQILQDRDDTKVAYFEDARLLVHLTPKASITQGTGATLLVARIEYSDIYNEPTLYIQLLKQEVGQNGLETSSHPKVKDMNKFLPDEYKTLFVVQPEVLDSSVWWCFHQCDTQEIVGRSDRNSDTYLKRWMSVFLFSWLND